MTMIKTEDGTWVNLSYVATVHPNGKDRNNCTRWILRNADGESLGVLVAHDEPDIERLFATYLPAVPGQTVYTFEVATRADGQRPTEADVFADPQAVIAWQINNRPWNRTIDPVLIEEFDEPSRVWHLMPDGSVCAPGSRSLASLDAAKADALQQAQADWDRDHQNKAA